MKYKITPAIICSKLEKHLELRVGIGVRAKQAVKNAVLYPPPMVRNTEYLYIDSYHSFVKQEDSYKGCHILLLDAPDNYDRVDCGLIMPFSETDAAVLYQYVMDIFSEFYEWIEMLHELERHEANLSRVLNKAAPFLEMELYLSSRDFDEEASTSGFHGTGTMPHGLDELSQEEVCARLNMQPDFETTFETQGVQPYPSPIGGMHYYYNIFDGKQFLVRLICLFPKKRYTQGFYQLVHYFCSFLEQIYLRVHHAGRTREQYRDFYDTLKKLLIGQFISREKTANALAAYQWEAGHSYQVVYLVPDSRQNHPDFRRYFIGQLENHHPSCRIAELQEELILVRNLSLEPDTSQEAEKLRCSLRDNQCKAGLSSIASDIEQISMLHTQAKDAFFYGSGMDDQRWYFEFEQYVPECVKAYCLKRYPGESLQHPALKVLRAYDQTNGTDLLPTLQAYVENRFSASSASASMYLHRSTFMHRMERIRQLTNLAFDDQRERLRLQLSFFFG